MEKVELGLGLLSLGRTWGVRDVSPPTEPKALQLISLARSKGIRFFDTAPAYGKSEDRLGLALSSSASGFKEAIVATKAGEHWQDARETTFVDHSFDALCASLDRSLDRLGRVDILQIHKATEDVVCAPAVAKFLLYAESLGVREFGASVSSVAAAERAIDTGLFQWLQYPLNESNGSFAHLGGRLRKSNMKSIINRPFEMGKLATMGSERRIAAFRHLLHAGLPNGSVILSGTSSADHLIENIVNFESASVELDSFWNSGRDHTWLL